MKKNIFKHIQEIIFKIPIIGTLYGLLYFFYKHLDLKKFLDKIYIEENFIKKLSLILSVNMRMDYMGRLYGVLNPHKEEMDAEDALLIYEITDKGTLDKTAFMEEWVYKKMNMLNTLLINESMFDLLLINIKHVGPEEDDNYLITLTPFYFNDFLFYLKKLKREIKWIFIICLILFIGFLSWKFLF